MENNFQGPVLIRVPPYMEKHTEPLCGQTEPLCVTNGKQLSVPRVNKGFPLYETSHTTTLWADGTTVCHQWKTTVVAPC